MRCTRVPTFVTLLTAATVITVGPACQDSSEASTTSFTGGADTGGPDTGDGTPGDGDPVGDGDGDSSDPTGDGDGDGEGTGDGDGDGEGTGDGDGDEDPTGDGGLCADVCGTPNCGPCPAGPAPVQSDGFVIDSTEVTTDQYAQFLAIEFDPDYLPGGLPQGCGFKQDFTPDGWLAEPPIGIPVGNVDWCDAYAYCTWVGGHLCGAIGGNPAALNDVQNPANNEWYRACSGGGVANYPYGLDYDPSACNTADAPFGQLTDAGGLPSCEGGLAGLFDMSGNVWEWTNACEDNDCRRGGSMYSDGNTSRCGIDSLRPRNLRDESQGFRCCAGG